MNRYPFWKYAIIAVALVVGILYTVPNFFPEVPAVQVSSSKSAVRIDNALMVSVEEALKGAGIAYRGAEMDPIGIKVRFADTDGMRHVNNAKYLTYCEIARIRYWTDVTGERFGLHSEGVESLILAGPRQRGRGGGER